MVRRFRSWPVLVGLAGFQALSWAGWLLFPTVARADTASPSEPTTTSTTAPPVAHERPDAAARLLALANRDRSSAGVGPLTSRSDVVQEALAHSWDMARQNTLFHNDSYFTDDNMRQLGATKVGQNVAENPDADNAHARLMASPGHRENLLDPSYRVVGISVVEDAQGELWITQDFVVPAAPAAPAPRPVARPAPAAPAAPVAPRPPARPARGAPSAPVPVAAAPSATTVPKPPQSVPPAPAAAAPVLRQFTVVPDSAPPDSQFTGRQPARADRTPPSWAPVLLLGVLLGDVALAGIVASRTRRPDIASVRPVAVENL
ncbi:MAG: CAP domain-containing protein [Acidimicrobiales bacterium]